MPSVLSSNDYFISAPKARLAAEGISLAQAFKDKYLIVMGKSLNIITIASPP